MRTPIPIDQLVAELRLRRLVKLAAAADSADGEAYASAAVEDGIFEVKEAGSDTPVLPAGQAELRTVTDHLKPFTFTQHFICNHRVAVDGDNQVPAKRTAWPITYEEVGGCCRTRSNTSSTSMFMSDDGVWRFIDADATRWRQFAPVSMIKQALDRSRRRSPSEPPNRYGRAGPASELAVVPRLVPNAADGWPVGERAVVAGGVVVVEPDGERCGSGV